ncbi:MAG: acyl-CoA synthetase [Rhodospirillales bacterium]|nr:acyl-CoA synthetase [Rhodospirillales bacterium]
MLPDALSYDGLRAAFRWQIPEYYNIGVDVCDRWADSEPERLALISVSPDGNSGEVSFGKLKSQSNRLANLLRALGVVPGDRVGILLPQMPETAIAHIAIHKLGAISLPLFMLFGEESLRYRLDNAEAKAVVTNAEGAVKLAAIRERLPSLAQILTVDGPAEGCHDIQTDLSGMAEHFQPVQTKAEDPAILIYTSGTTGPPKGALHAHRVLLGHLPGMEMAFDLFPQAGDRLWTPADWAWIGGLLDVLLPGLHHGVPVVACRFQKFTAEAAFALIERHGVRNAFLPPTALKMMRKLEPAPDPARLRMRSVASGGETLGATLIDWGRRVLGVTVNEFYGQTECNVVVSSCAKIMPPRPGIMGRGVPGHEVAVLSETGERLPKGKIGQIAVRAPDPVMFLGYWKNPEATAAKFAGDWLLTGDCGQAEDEGWIRYVGRDDDVITSSGYRIGPGEIEDCLIGHPAVALAGVVGKPDPTRTEIVKAYLVLAPGVERSDALAEEIQTWVRQRLAAYEYPREIDFVPDLPMTATGKIIRRVLRERARAETLQREKSS